MTIRETVIATIERVRTDAGVHYSLADDLPLADSGLDSLGVAIVVTRLEDSLGLDPFTDSAMSEPPVTVGEFVRLYEDAAKRD